MNYKQMFPSKFLRAVDIGSGGDNVVIDRVAMEMVGQGADAEEKSVLYIRDVTQGLILNITNANSIAAMHGDDTDDWIGRTITLFRTKVQFKADMVDAIRIKRPAEKAIPATFAGDEADAPF